MSQRGDSGMYLWMKYSITMGRPPTRKGSFQATSSGKVATAQAPKEDGST